MLKLEKRHRRLFLAILILALGAVSSLKLDVLGSVVTAVATAVIAYFTRTLWRTNENQLAHARTSDRAYLTGGGDIEDRDSRQFFRFDVENHGKTPAFTIAYDVQFAKLEELRREYPKAREVCKRHPHIDGISPTGARKEIYTDIRRTLDEDAVYGAVWYYDIWETSTLRDSF